MAGAGVYTYQLARALPEALAEHRLVVFARPGVLEDLVADNLRIVRAPTGSRAGRLLWEQTVLPLLLGRLRIDVLHSPHHHTPIAARLHNSSHRTRLVVTFHDVTFMLMPQRYTTARLLYMEGVTRAAARVADAIITPSQTVRRDVIRMLGVAPERIVAIPEAAAPQYTPVTDEDALGRMRWTYRLPNRYILSVGSLEPGKNRARLYQAYAKRKGVHDGVPIVVVGQRAWRYEREIALVKQLGLENDVRFLGYVPDDDLPALYSGAACVAFPSLYEGFGLPVLEAMACGAPVITSNVSATAEVADDAALLVDPTDTDALAQALDRVLGDSELRADLRTKGLARAQQYSWQRTARQTKIVYEIVAARR